jgi:hypothetical protein
MEAEGVNLFATEPGHSKLILPGRPITKKNSQVLIPMGKS